MRHERQRNETRETRETRERDRKIETCGIRNDITWEHGNMGTLETKGARTSLCTVKGQEAEDIRLLNRNAA